MAYRDPKTKEEIINRLTSMDFSGDLRDLAKDRQLQMQRLKRHVLRLIFRDSGEEFDLTVHKRRREKVATAPKVKRPVGRPPKAHVIAKRGPGRPRKSVTLN